MRARAGIGIGTGTGIGTGIGIGTVIVIGIGIGIGIALLGACSTEAERRAPVATPTFSAATQADLARDLDAAAENGSWSVLRRTWQGKALRWTVTRQRVLCLAADACNVAAFPIQRPATHGWMPELSFAPGQFAALAAKCGEAESCEVTIEGVLAKLEASDDAPTRLRFANVRIVDERTAAH